MFNSAIVLQTGCFLKDCPFPPKLEGLSNMVIAPVLRAYVQPNKLDDNVLDSIFPFSIYSMDEKY